MKKETMEMLMREADKVLEAIGFSDVGDKIKELAEKSGIEDEEAKRELIFSMTGVAITLIDQKFQNLTFSSPEMMVSVFEARAVISKFMQKAIPYLREDIAVMKMKRRGE